MDLHKELTKLHSKESINLIVDWIETSQKKFDKLFDIYKSENKILIQRASWAIHYCVKRNPSFIAKHWNTLIERVQNVDMPDAIHRNGIKIFEDITIPEAYEGKIMDICIRFVNNPSLSIAARAFSINTLNKLAKKYPDIIAEVTSIIKHHLPNEGAAFKSSAKRFLLLQTNKR